MGLRSPFVIAFALRRESLYFRGAFPPRRAVAGGPCPAYLLGLGPQPVVVLETGPGAPATARGLEWLLANLPEPPAVILSAGFSGALQPQAEVGDLVLASEVVSPAGQIWQATWAPDAGLPRGRLLCVSELVAEPTDKRRLGECFRAVAADMETAALAQLCKAHQIAFGCLRVISDNLATRLSPRLVTLVQGGRVSPRRLAAAVLRHPVLLLELWRLARATRTAARELAEGLGTLLGAPSALHLRRAGSAAE
jgi:adenosylhomocysteine nucleosidase